MNYTFTFLSGSDIRDEFGHFDKKAKITIEPMDVQRERMLKKKMAAWVVSNCQPPSKRDVYFEELRKHIEADKYSNCKGGNRKCYTKDCLTLVAKEYKFYFAAENSVCKDYITEKVYRNSYLLGMVPIVYGGANFSQYLPPHSYIDVKDFASPKDLAVHLKKVANDSDLYNQYFAWKRKYIVIRENTQCRLCEFVNRKDLTPKVYEDITKFWTTKDCVDGRQYLRSVLGH